MISKSLKLVRPRIDFLPGDVIRKIKQLEQRFILLQRQLRNLQPDYDFSQEPELVIPKITEMAIKYNEYGLDPAERSLNTMCYFFDYLLDENEDGSQEMVNMAQQILQ